jgi:tetratricopeptide (TPR) repeat protein
LGSEANQDNLKQAIAEYRAVLQLEPYNKAALQALGELAYNDVLTDRSKRDEAAEWFRRLASVDPGSEQAHYYLGLLAWSKAYSPVAQARQKLHIPADFQGPIPDQAVRESLAGQYDSVIAEGVENLREALAIKPDHEDAMSYLNLLLRLRSALDSSAEASARDLAEAERWIQLSVETRRQKQGLSTQRATPLPVIVAPPPAPPSNDAKPELPAISAKAAEANLESKADPVYPPLARSARLQGSVAFRVIVGEDGRIKRMMLERGHPLLVNAAREAILQYVYHPFLVDGRPAEVSTEVTVQFALP